MEADGWVADGWSIAVFDLDEELVGLVSLTSEAALDLLKDHLCDIELGDDEVARFGFHMQPGHTAFLGYTRDP